MKECVPYIRVSGEGMIKVRPDMAEVTISIVTEDREAKEAQERNAEIVNKVVTGLHSFGILDDQIQTVQYTIEPEYDFSDGKQIFRHFQVTHSLRINVNNTAKVGELIDLVIQLGANRIGSVQFGLSHTEAYKNQALQLASQNAYFKAASLAQSSGVKLHHPPIKIVEGYEENRESPRPFTAELAAASMATAVNPGQISIKSRVEVWYSFS